MQFVFTWWGKLVWNLSPSTSFWKKTHEVGGLVSILKDIGTVVEMVSFAYSLLCGYGYSCLQITLSFFVADGRSC